MSIEYLLVSFAEKRAVLADGAPVGFTNHMMLLPGDEYLITLDGDGYQPLSQDVVLSGTSLVKPMVIAFTPAAAAAAAASAAPLTITVTGGAAAVLTPAAVAPAANAPAVSGPAANTPAARAPAANSPDASPPAPRASSSRAPVKASTPRGAGAKKKDV